MAILVGLFMLTTAGHAKFVQEVELKDGTVLVGYVYRQQPGRFMVFHVDRVRKDTKVKYKVSDKNYTLQWKEVRAIRRSDESDLPWCNDKVTLKDGTTYIGQIEEQILGESIVLQMDGDNEKKTIRNSDLQIMEKIAKNIDYDLWTDRQYTNRLKLTDKSLHEGLIVLQYRGEKTADCYVELLHSAGFKERIYLPDIAEYIIQLK